MKKNKKLYGLMAGVLAIALATPLVSHVAKADSLYSDVVAWYDFNDGALTNSKGSSQATSILQGLGSYAGDLQFDTDRTSEDGKSLKLDGYGIELNQQNLGDNFSVSLWVKPNVKVPVNTPVVFLGYHNPEKWYGISGNEYNSNDVKIWVRNPNGGFNGWFQKGYGMLAAGDWHHIVITGEGDTHKTYIDGVLCTSGSANGVDNTYFTSALSGDNQDIYIGVNNWDPTFNGEVDDVIVYKRAITAGEVERLYTGETVAQILAKSEITVADISTAVKRTTALEVTIPEAVKDDAKISFKVDDESVATVDKDGNVTGKKAGTTKVTVTAKIDSVEKTAEATITVESSLSKYLAASYSFDGNIDDATGNSKAEVFGKKFAKYNGSVDYADGVFGKAVDFKNYGVKLNLKDLGTEFTVNFYVKPEAKQAENQVMMLLGYHDPELWTAISGTGRENVYKLWANTAAKATTRGNVTAMSWTTLVEPEIKTGEWTMVTLVGTDGKLSCYLDGILIGTKNYNNPLCGGNQDIYFGVNNWDACFDGLIDEVKVYSIGLSQDEILESNSEFIGGKLQSILDSVVSEEVVLGKNLELNAIKYDLLFPQYAGGSEIVWSSSNEKVLSSSGKITYPKENTKVTLTATVSNAAGSATNTFELTVLALDKTKLNELVAKAKAVDKSNLDEISAERLNDAIKLAEEADNFEKVETAELKLAKAIASATYKDIYADPFAEISEAKVTASIVLNDKQEVFSLPEKVEGSVTVKYVSEDEKVAKYDDGVVKAVGVGKTIVTAIVTANSDGYVMEYSTAVSVAKKSSGAGSSSGTISAGNVSGNKNTQTNTGSRNTETTTDNTQPATVNTQTATANTQPADTETDETGVIEEETTPTAVETVEETKEDTAEEIKDEEIPAAGGEIEKPAAKSFMGRTFMAIVIVILAIFAATFVYLKTKKTK